MTRDPDFDVGRLIDGDLDRAERIALLAELANDPTGMERLASALRVERDLTALGGLYDHAEPSPGLVPAIFAALDKEMAKPSLASAVSGLTAAARRLLTPLDDARLAGVIAGAEPPPAPVGDPGTSTSREAGEDCSHPSNDPVGSGRQPAAPLEAEEGSVAFRVGDGDRIAGASVRQVDLGALGSMEDGNWQLVLDSGVARPAGAERIELRAAVGAKIVLLDGSSLTISEPLAIVWRKPS